MSLKVWIHGYTGRMGQAIKAVIADAAHGLTYLGGSAEHFETNDQLHGKPLDKQALSNRVDMADVILDFSTVAGNETLLETLSTRPRKGQALLIGTTGLDHDVVAMWQKIAVQQNLRILLAPNTSLGILLLSRMTQDLTKVLRPENFDLEITESHHRNKVDSPSGTALLLAESAQAADPSLITVYGRNESRKANEIGMQSIRGGNIYGEHTVMFLGNNEEIHISHRALSRSLFASGAVTLTKWLTKQKAPGFYRLSDIELKDL